MIELHKNKYWYFIQTYKQQIYLGSFDGRDYYLVSSNASKNILKQYYVFACYKNIHASSVWALSDLLKRKFSDCMENIIPLKLAAEKAQKIIILL